MADHGGVADLRRIDPSGLLDVVVDQVPDLGIFADDAAQSLVRLQAGAVAQQAASPAGPVRSHRHRIGRIRAERSTRSERGDPDPVSGGPRHIHVINQACRGIEVVRAGRERPALLSGTGIVTGRDLQQVLSRTGDGIDPAVIRALQVVLHLLARQGNHEQLVLIRIDRKHIVEYQGPRLDASVVGQRSRHRDLRPRRLQADRVDQVHVVAHSLVGIPRPEIGLQFADRPERKGFHRLEVRPERLPHPGIRLLRIHGNQVRGQRLGHDPAFLDLHVDPPVSDIAHVAAGIDQADAVPVQRQRPVVVGTDHEIHALQRLEQVLALALQHTAIPVAGPRVDGHDHHLGMLPGDDRIHIFLHQRDQRQEIQAFPQALIQPALHVGVVVTQHRHFQARFMEHCIGLEIRLPGRRIDHVAAQERDACRLDVRRDPVIDPVPGLDVVVASHDGIIAQMGHQTGIDVRRDRIHVVEIIGRIVALQEVARVQQQHIVLPDGIADAVRIVFERIQRAADAAAHIGRIEVRSVDVIGREKMQRMDAVLRAAGNKGGGQGCEGEEKTFHGNLMK